MVPNALAGGRTRRPHASQQSNERGAMGSENPQGNERGAMASENPQGNERGAMASENPPAYWNPCFSLLGMVLIEPWLRSKTPFPPMPLPR